MTNASSLIDERQSTGPINNGVALRMLPLGDSITWGYQSADGNGYRWALLNRLAIIGNTVEYVGSQTSGDMVQNHNEGHPGAVISEIATYADQSLPDRPNVVLLMAGTNDCGKGLTGAPDRLSSLIDQVVAACPDAAVIVAQITPMADATAEANAQTFNAAIPDIVASKVNAGNKVLLVNQSDYVTVNDLIDGLHPTGHGYDLMSECWLAGIQQAGANGWIQAPVNV